MSYRRRQLLLTVVMVVLAVGGISLALLLSRSPSRSTETATQPGSTQTSPIGTNPVVTTTTTSSGSQKTQTFTLKTPVVAQSYYSDPSSEELRFTISGYNARVRSVVSQPGSTLDQVAGDYGDVGSAKSILVGGHPGYLFASNSGDWESLIAVTTNGTRDYFIQLSVPTSKLSLGIKMIRQLGRETTLSS